MRKPKTRKERVDFIIAKTGDFYLNEIASMSDKKFKHFFEGVYIVYKDKDNFFRPIRHDPECVICSSTIESKWECFCGEAIADENDPYLLELKASGQFDELRDKHRVEKRSY